MPHLSETNDTPAANMALIDHLRELKRRIAYALLAFVISSIACYFVAEPIYQFLLQPLVSAHGGEPTRMIYTGLTEAFMTYIKLAMWAGFTVAFPVIAYHCYGFISPALYKHEKNIFVPYLIAAPTLFAMGMLLAYYCIFPLAWKFFLGFEMPGGSGAMAIQLEARVSEYLSLVITIMLAFGLAFQLPLVLMLLAHAGILTASMLRKSRRIAIVGIFIVAAVLTPPDIISQFGLAIPLLLLYEGAICGVKIIEKKRTAKAGTTLHA